MNGISCKTLLAPGFQRLSYRCAIALYLSILVMGSIPGARADIGEYAPGVVLHSLAYAILALLLFVGSSGNKHERAIKSVLTVLAMGAFDEYVQRFFPYRTASVADWVVDASAGILASVMLCGFWSKLTGPE